MRRRTILKWLSSSLAAVSASLVTIPGVGFIAERLRRGPASQSRLQRVAKLRDLPVGVPILMPVIGSRQDAWTAYPSETIGRVWLVRRGSGSSDGEVPVVDAFTSICPHLGCQIQLDGPRDRFICPCHKATFNKSGEPMSSRLTGYRNHAPRNMDSLECTVVKDEQTNEWWVEVKYEKFELGLTTKVAQA